MADVLTRTIVEKHCAFREGSLASSCLTTQCNRRADRSRNAREIVALATSAGSALPGARHRAPPDDDSLQHTRGLHLLCVLAARESHALTMKKSSSPSRPGEHLAHSPVPPLCSPLEALN
jgi:hypothetical protein